MYFYILFMYFIYISSSFAGVLSLFFMLIVFNYPTINQFHTNATKLLLLRYLHDFKLKYIKEF